MTESEFLALALSNRANAQILARLPALGLADCWLVSGCLFQTRVERDGRPSAGTRHQGLRSVLFRSGHAPGRRKTRPSSAANAAFADLGVVIELRNQARVHLWYATKFGAPYPPLARATDGIDRFLSRNCMVGIRPNGQGFETMRRMASTTSKR